VSLFAANEGFLQDVPVARVLDFERGLIAYMHQNHGEFMRTVTQTGAYNDEIVAEMRSAIQAYKATVSF
jgi:F-type H+-transporting ATPase subunit alpha